MQVLANEHAVASEKLGQSLPVVKPELRVLHIFSVLSVGGAETWLMSLLRYFREEQRQLPFKISFDVLLTGGEPSVFDDEAAALGANLFYVSFRRNNLPGFRREFRRILASGSYDVIHDHQDYISGVHFMMGRGHLPAVRIAHIHNPLYQRTTATNGPARRGAQLLGKRLIGRYATHVMGTSRQIVSEYGFDNLETRGVELGAAYCGFDSRRFHRVNQHADVALRREFGWDEASKVILFLGRLESDEVLHLGRMMTHKNPALALEIAIECMRRDKSVRLLMVGEGGRKQKTFEALVKELGFEERVRFCGLRHDVPELMHGSDLLLFPSLGEGLGMVTVEAQAAGLRVLASDTTPREAVVVPDMVTFLSLEASVDRWADDALRLIKMDRPDADACNKAVRNSKFSIESSAARLVHLYASQKQTSANGQA